MIHEAYLAWKHSRSGNNAEKAFFRVQDVLTPTQLFAEFEQGTITEVTELVDLFNWNYTGDTTRNAILNAEYSEYVVKHDDKFPSIVVLSALYNLARIEKEAPKSMEKSVLGTETYRIQENHLEEVIEGVRQSSVWENALQFYAGDDSEAKEIYFKWLKDNRQPEHSYRLERL